MIRGGSWLNDARNCRAANRNRNEPQNRNDNLGFRVAAAPRARGGCPAGRNRPLSSLPQGNKTQTWAARVLVANVERSHAAFFWI